MEKFENGGKNPNRIYNNWAILTISIGVFLLICLPYILTNFDIGWSFGSQNENPIGDTIGGISAPIIGLVSSVLVYLALKAQIDANSLIYKQFEYERNNQDEKIYFEYLSRELDSISKFVREFKTTPKFKDEYLPFLEERDFCSILDEFVFSNVNLTKYDIDYSAINFFIYIIKEKLSFYNQQKVKNKSYSKLIVFKIESLLQLLWSSTTNSELIECEDITHAISFNKYINGEIVEDIIDFKYEFAKLKKDLNLKYDSEKKSIGELNKLLKYFYGRIRLNDEQYLTYNFMPEDYEIDFSDYPELI